jgi:hypothetical protein
MSDKFPIIISVKKYSAYNYLRNATIKHNLPAQNYYEFNCIDNGLNIVLHNKFGSTLSNVKQIPQYNGDLWLVAKGFSDQTKQFPIDYQFGLFFDFNEKKGEGFLFNNFMLHNIITTFFQPKRLFLFACYQGNYLPSYLQSISCLQEAYGIKSGADFTNLNKELLLYFKTPSSYKL